MPFKAIGGPVIMSHFILHRFYAEWYRDLEI